MKFKLESTVRIKELEMKGVVKSIFMASRGWEYEVRYFNQGKAELFYFFESELESVAE